MQSARTLILTASIKVGYRPCQALRQISVLPRCTGRRVGSAEFTDERMIMGMMPIKPFERNWTTRPLATDRAPLFHTPAARSWLARTTLLAAAFATLTASSGCMSSILRQDKPKPKSEVKDDEQKLRLVRDLTRVWGLRPTLVQGVGMVSQLNNTGSDPGPSPHRDMLLDDMRRRNVSDPSRILSSPQTSLVLVKAVMPAGTQKGDRLDVEVRTIPRSETESLRDGWLMPTRLQEMAVLGARIRQGNLMGSAEGAVLVDSLFEADTDKRSETSGRILGGAISNIDRSLALVLSSEHHSPRTSALIGAAINQRFHTYDRGTKRGVATPKRDNYIELTPHRRYRRNLLRYARVVQAVALREPPRALIERMDVLEGQLLAPSTAVSAAVDLEAIGDEALPTLRRGLESEEPLVRFAAAEAMAYMNEPESVDYLVESARHESAFRYHSLVALSAMTETRARDGLVELLHEPSDETRYGAFESLIAFNPRDPATNGKVIGEVMALHQIQSSSEPLVHVRLTKRPEIVLFGGPIKVELPAVLMAGSKIMIKSEPSGRVKVSRFAVGEDDQSQYCDQQLSSIIEAIVGVGGSYTDVVSAIKDAKQKNKIAARVKYDAIPKPGREYQLGDVEESDEAPFDESETDTDTDNETAFDEPL